MYIEHAWFMQKFKRSILYSSPQTQGLGHKCTHTQLTFWRWWLFVDAVGRYPYHVVRRRERFLDLGSSTPLGSPSLTATPHGPTHRGRFVMFNQLHASHGVGGDGWSFITEIQASLNAGWWGFGWAIHAALGVFYVFQDIVTNQRHDLLILGEIFITTVSTH